MASTMPAAAPPASPGRGPAQHSAAVAGAVQPEDVTDIVEDLSEFQAEGASRPVCRALLFLMKDAVVQADVQSGSDPVAVCAAITDWLEPRLSLERFVLAAEPFEAASSTVAAGRAGFVLSCFTAPATGRRYWVSVTYF